MRCLENGKPSPCANDPQPKKPQWEMFKPAKGRDEIRHAIKELEYKNRRLKRYAQKRGITFAFVVKAMASNGRAIEALKWVLYGTPPLTLDGDLDGDPKRHVV